MPADNSMVLNLVQRATAMPQMNAVNGSTSGSRVDTTQLSGRYTLRFSKNLSEIQCLQQRAALSVNFLLKEHD